MIVCFKHFLVFYLIFLNLNYVFNREDTENIDSDREKLDEERNSVRSRSNILSSDEKQPDKNLKKLSSKSLIKNNDSKRNSRLVKKLLENFDRNYQKIVAEADIQFEKQISIGENFIVEKIQNILKNFEQTSPEIGLSSEVDALIDELKKKGDELFGEVIAQKDKFFAGLKKDKENYIKETSKSSVVDIKVVEENALDKINSIEDKINNFLNFIEKKIQIFIEKNQNTDKAADNSIENKENSEEINILPTDESEEIPNALKKPEPEPAEQEPIVDKAEEKVEETTTQIIREPTVEQKQIITPITDTDDLVKTILKKTHDKLMKNEIELEDKTSENKKAESTLPPQLEIDVNNQKLISNEKKNSETDELIEVADKIKTELFYDLESKEKAIEEKFDHKLEVIKKEFKKTNDFPKFIKQEQSLLENVDENFIQVINENEKKLSDYVIRLEGFKTNEEVNTKKSEEEKKEDELVDNVKTDVIVTVNSKLTEVEKKLDNHLAEEISSHILKDTEEFNLTKIIGQNKTQLNLIQELIQSPKSETNSPSDQIKSDEAITINKVSTPEESIEKVTNNNEDEKPETKEALPTVYSTLLDNLKTITDDKKEETKDLDEKLENPVQIQDPVEVKIEKAENTEEKLESTNEKESTEEDIYELVLDEKNDLKNAEKISTDQISQNKNVEDDNKQNDNLLFQEKDNQDEIIPEQDKKIEQSNSELKTANENPVIDNFKEPLAVDQKARIENIEKNEKLADLPIVEAKINKENPVEDSKLVEDEKKNLDKEETNEIKNEQITDVPLDQVEIIKENPAEIPKSVQEKTTTINDDAKAKDQEKVEVKSDETPLTPEYTSEKKDKEILLPQELNKTDEKKETGEKPIIVESLPKFLNEEIDETKLDTKVEIVSPLSIKKLLKQELDKKNNEIEGLVEKIDSLEQRIKNTDDNSDSIKNQQIAIENKVQNEVNVKFKEIEKVIQSKLTSFDENLTTQIKFLTDLVEKIKKSQDQMEKEINNSLELIKEMKINMKSFIDASKQEGHNEFNQKLDNKFKSFEEKLNSIEEHLLTKLQENQ